MKLEELPVEAVARILSFLDWKDLLVVSKLCRFLHEVYQSFPELQLPYAMQTYGMIDTDPTLSMQCKLSEIERRERAWRELDPLHKVTVKVPHRTSNIRDLSGGVYLLGDRKNSLVSHDTKTLRFFDLSTCTTGPTTNIVDGGFGLYEFDLVAVVGVTPPLNEEQGSIVLSFRELSTGAPHPLAKRPDVFVDPVYGHEGKLSIMMEIVGPTSSLAPGLTEIAPPSTWDDFAFLSPALILLPNNDHTLEIVRLPDVSKPYCSPPIGFERVLILELPALQPLVRIDKIRCRSEPNPKGAMHPRAAQIWSENTEYTRRKRRSPMSPDPMKTIVLLRFYYREYPNEGQYIQMGGWGVLRHSISLVLRRQFLLDIARELERSPVLTDVMKKSDRGKKPCAPSLPWRLWSTNAWWQAADMQLPHRVMTSAGQRYLGHGIDENGNLVVKDFNPYTVRRARAVQRPGYCVAAEELMAGTGDESGLKECLSIEWMMEIIMDSGWNLLRRAVQTCWGRIAPTERKRMHEAPTDDSLFYTPDSSDSPPSSNSGEDTTWQRVRIIEEYDEVEEAELRQLFNEKCSSPLPCVEYVSKKSYDYHGLLMDDERIIGLRHNEHWSIVEFDVFTM
ncbi:uncharacterized protein FOMMEDRAFT_154315 [Fomitiporia mediterranea MF3/22]|uniref:uncharacterized protein n=1 Tax=Fomitiporia mediterranea (strain MF3/22) TaxID=694068 RepID=UPI00044079A0|nr:uncharacterized protein FOMMEDRAFT_154315 [Fomitiporia mediterranea MF3/22]EJD05128.1 hypothetical protein FOMMEDRAFT_154315 [Fomitiporia mediterranea MF3/22]